MYFGHGRGERFSLFVFDNRGAAESDELWCGIARRRWLGGMIVQEVTVLLQERVASLDLRCTTLKLEDTGTFAEKLGRRGPYLLGALRARSFQQRRSCFPQEWLGAPDDAEQPTESTPRCELPACGDKMFESNYELLVAQKVHM
ncbi:hypothetical protein F5Y05DRAFT_408420 [Hypoxylon sp. FL0543]|nr:hypothetical protein F5Y05DRAFT_408420 [Hypoxylon sp. FL0543]